MGAPQARWYSPGGWGVKAFRYSAPGWGVGEVWLDGERVVWHEAPARGRPGRWRLASAASASSAYFAGEPVTFDDVELDLEEYSDFHRELAPPSGACPAGRSSPTESWLRSPAGRRPPRGRHVLRPQPARDRHPVPPGRRGGRARVLRGARRRLQAAPARARGMVGRCRCPRTSARSSRRSTRSGRAAGSRSSPRSYEPPARCTCAAAVRSPAPRRRQPRGRARVFALLRGFGVGAEIRTYRRRAFGQEPRYELHLGDDPRAVQTLNEAGVLDAGSLPFDEPPRRVVARSCCRAAYLRGALLAAGSVSGPRNAHLELRTATPTADVPRGPRTGRGDRATRRRARPPCRRLREGRERDRRAARLRRRARRGARARGERGRRRHAAIGRTGSRTPTTRTSSGQSRSAQAQVRAIRRRSNGRTLETLPPDLREIAELRLRHPDAPSASSPRAAGRPRRRRPSTAGSNASSASRRPTAPADEPSDQASTDRHERTARANSAIR